MHSSGFITDKNNKLEYGQIILGHINKILKLSLMDVCSGEISGRYKSAIVCLGDSLIAYFDDEMDTAQDNFNNKVKEHGSSLSAYRLYFRELLKLVKRVDYFKSSVYGESDVDDEINDIDDMDAQ